MPRTATQDHYARLFHVESEPGDATRYSFGLLRDEDRQRWVVFPEHSTFKFPVFIHDWDQAHMLEAKIKAGDSRHSQVAAMQMFCDMEWANSCNPYTLLEVVNCIEQFCDD